VHKGTRTEFTRELQPPVTSFSHSGEAIMGTESQGDRDEEGDFHGMRISGGLTSAAENDESLRGGKMGGSDPRETYLE